MIDETCRTAPKLNRLDVTKKMTGIFDDIYRSKKEQVRSNTAKNRRVSSVNNNVPTSTAAAANSKNAARNGSTPGRKATEGAAETPKSIDFKPESTEYLTVLHDVINVAVTMAAEDETPKAIDTKKPQGHEGKPPFPDFIF
jgi:hypothetical protein